MKNTRCQTFGKITKLYKLPVGEKFGIISNDLNNPPPLNKKIHYFNHYINLSKIYFV